MSVRWMEVKGTYEILTFFNYIVTNINGGVSVILGVYWGVGTTHLVRCKVYQKYLEFCFKVHLFGF